VSTPKLEVVTVLDQPKVQACCIDLFEPQPLTLNGVKEKKCLSLPNTLFFSLKFQFGIYQKSSKNIFRTFSNINIIFLW
jgi:hypothetical protein